ncbi:MAG: hypothetical protein AAB804_02330 [Patescibacteria group bacterium]
MQPDDELVVAFFRSYQWKEAKTAEAFKHKRGLKDAIRAYLRIEYYVPNDAPTPLEIEKATGRVELAIRSKWAKKAAKTRAYRSKRKLAERKRKLAKLIERFEKAWKKTKQPMLFSDLPKQARPPRGNVGAA